MNAPSGSHVRGDCSLAERLRARLAPSTRASVIVVDVDPTPTPVGDLDDAAIERLWERPMQSVIGALQEAHRGGRDRIVVVVPTLGQSGGASYAAQSALAEAARVLVKSAARQWSDRSVNAVVLEPGEWGIDSSVSGPVSIAPRARSGAVDPVPLIEWLSGSGATDVTGQTVVCDGGQWM